MGWLDLNADETAEDVVLPVETRVKQGMVRLDEQFGPEWVKRIDLDSLVLADGCQCVLGQMYGEFDVGMGALLGEPYWTCEQAVDLGFERGDGATYPDLDNAWRDAIQRRRCELGGAS